MTLQAPVQAPLPSGRTHQDLLARTKKALDSAKRVAVPITDIRRCETQPRKFFGEDSILRLSSSIDAGGQMTPGMIRRKAGKTEYELIDGERRWRAVKLIPAGRRPLYKADLIEAADDVVQFLISGTVNFNREGHTPLETMETIDRLVKLGFPMQEIADLLGYHSGWCYQMHGLKNLNSEVRAMLDPELPKAKKLPLTAAIHISKAAPRLQTKLAERIVSRDVSLATLRTEVVRVSQQAGTTIRLREVAPLKRWESVTNKADVLVRTASDMEAILHEEVIGRIAGANKQEANALLARFRQAKETIARCEARLLVTQKKR